MPAARRYLPVRGARGHDRHDRHPGHSSRVTSDRLHQLGRSGEGGLGTVRGHGVTVIARSPRIRSSSARLRSPARRDDAAVDGRARRLRQRVVRVPALEPRRDARRPEQRVVARRRARAATTPPRRRALPPPPACLRRAPPPYRRPCARRSARVTSVSWTGNSSVRASSPPPAVDRIVLAGQRAVPAPVGHFEREGRVNLLGRLHLLTSAPSLMARRPPRSAVLRVDQRRGASSSQRRHCRRRLPRRPSARRSGRARAPSLPASSGSVRDEDRCHGLVVARAAPVEVAVALEEHERDRPTSPRAAPPPRRGARAGASAPAAAAAQAGDQVALARRAGARTCTSPAGKPPPG